MSIEALRDQARAKLQEALSAHAVVVLNFGGGKDSLACLYLLQHWWDRITVLWGNMGDPFPETVTLMKRVREMVGNFVEARGNARAATEHVYPVDLLPIRATALGRMFEPEGAQITLRSRFECCAENLFLPVGQATKDLGATLVIRGQRDSETLRSPLRDGVALQGVELCLPIQDWSEADVFAYLALEGVELPRSYEYTKTSLDCMHCTAFGEEAHGRYRYLAEHHPEVANEYARRLELIAGEQIAAMHVVRLNLEEAR